jgi:hypothetical protein
MPDPVEPPKGKSVEEVLASIRRLVTEEEAQFRRTPPLAPDSLLLTTDMRVDAPEPAPPGTPAAAAPPDTEMLGELVRQVLREELEGEFGSRLSANLRKLVRREVGRALAAKLAE